MATSTEKTGFRNPLNLLILAVSSRFGDKSKEVERFLKFAVVGVTGAIMDFGILFILQASILHPVDIDGRTKLYTFGIQNAALASGIAFLCAVINNFVWTRHWVYPESKKNSFRRQFAAFALLSIVGGVARTLWVSWSFLWIGEALMPYVLPFIQIVRHGYVPSPQAPAKLGTMAAQMIGMVIVMLWNFFANRYITYRDVR